MSVAPLPPAARPAPRHGRGRILDPGERASEVLFGVIMTMTFTGTLSVVDAGQGGVRAMLLAALGCNIAWGLIDGIIYLMYCRLERASTRLLYERIRADADPVEAGRLIADALPPLLAQAARADDLERLRQRVLALPVAPEPPRLHGRDWLGGLAIFLLVVCTTFPLAAPFLLIDALRPAMRVSNAIGVAMLFLTGVIYARGIARSPWRTGLAMMGLGLVLVLLTIALGG